MNREKEEALREKIRQILPRCDYITFGSRSVTMEHSKYDLTFKQLDALRNLLKSDEIEISVEGGGGCDTCGGDESLNITAEGVMFDWVTP